MSSRWWLAKVGRPEGPFDEADLVRRVIAGEIAASQSICADGQANWHRIADEPRFARYFDSGSHSVLAGISGPEMPSAEDATVTSVLPPTPFARVPAVVAPPISKKTARDSADVLGLILANLPIFAGVLMIALHSHRANLMILGAVLVLTALFVVIDTRTWKLQWWKQLLIALIPIVGLPMYLDTRTKCGAPSRLMNGMFGLVFMFFVAPMLSILIFER